MFQIESGVDKALKTLTDKRSEENKVSISSLIHPPYCLNLHTGFVTLLYKQSDILFKLSQRCYVSFE